MRGSENHFSELTRPPSRKWRDYGGWTVGWFHLIARFISWFVEFFRRQLAQPRIKVRERDGLNLLLSIYFSLRLKPANSAKISTVLERFFERGADVSGRCDHMAGMGNFVLGNLPNLIGEQRDDGESFASEGHEFDGAAFAALVNEHDRADVVPCQTMLRQVGRQYHAVEFFNHVIHPKDMLWLM